MGKRGDLELKRYVIVIYTGFVVNMSGIYMMSLQCFNATRFWRDADVLSKFFEFVYGLQKVERYGLKFLRPTERNGFHLEQRISEMGKDVLYMLNILIGIAILHT